MAAKKRRDIWYYIYQPRMKNNKKHNEMRGMFKSLEEARSFAEENYAGNYFIKAHNIKAKHKSTR